VDKEPLKEEQKKKKREKPGIGGEQRNRK